MRLFPILSAIVVVAAIYGVVFERARLLALLPEPLAELAQGISSDAKSDAKGSADAAPGDEGQGAAAPERPSAPAAVSVVALHSTARQIDKAVIVRGRTEADRKVDLRAETSGQVISEPRPKGSIIAAGDVLCRLDPGARQAALDEAQALLAEAKARVPEAQARLPEAEARLSQAKAQLADAMARVEEAKINANAAARLVWQGFASKTRVAATRAALRGAEAAVASARAAIRTAEANREAVAAGLEAARAGVRSAEAARAAAEREIELLTITAPFSGLLDTDSAELGSLLQPGSLCATLLDLDPIMLVGFVSETQVARVKVGAPARARLASGDEAAGKVTFVARSADPVTRTFRVEAAAPNPDLSLRDGQSAEITIATAGANAHLLPQSALTLDDAGRLGVRIVDADTRARFVAVSLVRDTPEGVWVTGLPERADVITIGQEYVTDGVPVAPTYRDLSQ